MQRVHQDTGLSVTNEQIEAEHPGLMFGPGHDLSYLGYPWLIEVPPPSALHARGPNELVDGQWRMTWATPSPEQVADAFIRECTGRAQSRLDAWAQTRGYDGIVSLCSYATSGNATFSAEGARGHELRDGTWQTLIDMKDAVIAGTRTMPGSWEAVEAELPELKWHDE